MTEIRPFQGIRYNQQIVTDLSKIICPPYDVISEERRRDYYERSDYNMVRLEHPLAPVASEAAQSNDDKYSRAAASFKQWLEQGILQIDDRPAFYLHDHYFTYLGERKRRRGLLARVRLRPWYSGVYPHEETFSKAKGDRLRLMRACRASFGPLFTLYQDPQEEVGSVLSKASEHKAITKLDTRDESHVVWAITDPELIRQISGLMTSRALYIADGHHRYETALMYQQERTRLHSELHEEYQTRAFNYVMMLLVPFSDPGLVVFPVHRVIRGIAPSSLAGLEDRLREFFVLEYVPITGGLAGILKSKMVDGHLMGILGLKSNTLIVLRQRQGISMQGIMPEDRSGAYRDLDISLLNHLILGRMLGISEDSEKITYVADVDEVCQQLDKEECQIAFLLNPPQPKVIKAIADARDRMPRKSTYFYPKPPAGLVINSLD
ncbi:MAG: DUF1015 domain-containing protein [Chloroflexota bacterium]|nr:DUF1015 domain-containing protein [Chloroflexota bacterium]